MGSILKAHPSADRSMVRIVGRGASAATAIVVVANTRLHPPVHSLRIQGSGAAYDNSAATYGHSQWRL